MATADRLYEIACECRDNDTKMEALLRDSQRQSEALAKIRESARALLEDLDGVTLPAEAAFQVAVLQALVS